MLVLKKESDQRNQWYAVGATALILVILYLFLTGNSISDPSSRRIILTELSVININDFIPFEEPEEVVTEEDPTEVSEEEEVIPEEEVVEEVVAPPTRIDLSELLPEGVKVDLSISKDLPELAEKDEPERDLGSQSLRLQDSELDQFEGIRSLRGAGTQLDVSQRSVGGDGGGSGLELSGGGLQRRNSGLAGIRGGIGLAGGPAVRSGWEEAIEVSLKSLAELGDGFETIDPVVNQLIDWMKENPVELPIAVKRTMSDNRWQDDFLTTSSRFVAGDREFELLIMVKETIPELHIFLVEADQATYLIDRGFQKQSSYLRRGRVIYNEESIQEVDSQMREASSSQTSEFYQVFLSWWDSIDSER
jgi:hypothetical protein